MQSDFLDRKLYKMAEQEQMAVSEDLDARVDFTASGEKRQRQQTPLQLPAGGDSGGSLSGTGVGDGDGIRNVSGTDGKHES